MLHATVFALGLIGGFFSGLLGIGGGILMTPLLLYVPSLLQVGTLDIKQVAGLTMAQGLAGSLSGVVVHHRFKHVSKSLLAVMGPTIALTALSGAWISKQVHSHFLLALFAIMAFVAAFMMFLPKADQDDAVVDTVKFNIPLAVLVAAIVGFLGGLVGQGGAFLLVPLMLYVLKIPTRITVGTSLGVVLCSAVAGFIGKLGTNQIPLDLAVPLVLGVLPGAQIGGLMSQHTPTRALRLILAVLIAFTAAKMGFEVWRR